MSPTIVLLILVAANMHLYSDAHIIYGDYAHDIWDPELVRSVLSQLTPENMRVDLLLPHFNRTAAGMQSILITLKVGNIIWEFEDLILSMQMCRWIHGSRLRSQ